MRHLKYAVAALAASALFAGAAAQDKPAEIKIGVTTFLSGPASVFGVPGKAAAEMIAEDINKKGGIGGVPVKLSFVDEGAGGEALCRTIGAWCRMRRLMPPLLRSLREAATNLCRWPKT